MVLQGYAYLNVLKIPFVFVSFILAHTQTRFMKKSSVNYQDPHKGKAVRQMFAGIAQRYDFMNHLLSFRQDQAWRRFSVRNLKLGPNARILDLCCGTGDLALEFCRQLGEHADIVASDFTPEMISVAQKKAVRYHNKNHGRAPKYSIADSLHLPFADKSFDACSIGFGLRNLESIEAGLKEMYRVLKPGGQAVILEFTQPPNALFLKVYRFYMHFLLPRIGAFFSRSKEKAYSYLPESVGLFPGAPELARLMEKQGFQEVHYFYKTFGVVAIHYARRAEDSPQPSV